MEICPNDLQTARVLQGMILITNNCPDVKLVVDYDKEIVMILPKDYKIFVDVGEVLKRWGWENLEHYPHMWQYIVDGDVAEYYESNNI